MSLDPLRYPIGQYTAPESITNDHIQSWIGTIRDFPNRMRALTENMSEEQLDTPYREGGWTVRQVVFHCGDSHVNSYMRFKWAMAEDNPLIKAYEEKDWAELPDAKHGPLELALGFLDGLHARWAYMLDSLTEAQLQRTFLHPETGDTVRTDWNIGNYAWHCDHHLAHVAELVKRRSW